MATAPPSDAATLAGGKGLFANRVRRFADRVAALPGFPVLWIASLAAVLLMTVVGGYGTGDLPPATRGAFWLALIGWNAAKWQCWFAVLVRDRAGWMRAALIGAVVLNLPLPVEIALALRLVGIDAPVAVSRAWIQALAISGTVLVVIAAATRSLRTPPTPDAPTPAADVLLARAGVRDPALLVAIEAEDHYCRLHLADGRAPLVHARFGDALAAVAAIDGLRVHRGAWAAAAHVAGARREDRRWWLLLDGGARLPVSRSYLAAVRARGWLRRSAVASARPRG